jgi:OPA family sugar phosphate sensor protein UhpC-like MFS transporter
VFAGTWLGYAGFYLCRKNFSVLMPLLSADLLFTKEDLANLIFFYSVAYAIGQFAFGVLADRFGAKVIVAGGMLVSALCNLLMSGATAFSFFLLLQCCNGLAQSCGWPGLVKITAAWFDPQRRGVLMAWWTTNYALGGVIATIIATALATGDVLPFLGWRRGAAGPALLLILVATVFLALVKERPSSEDSQERTGSPWVEVLRCPNIWSIAVCYFCLKLMRYAFLF